MRHTPYHAIDELMHVGWMLEFQALFVYFSGVETRRSHGYP